MTRTPSVPAPPAPPAPPVPGLPPARRRSRRAPALLLALVLVACAAGGAWLVSRGPAVLAAAIGPADAATGPGRATPGGAPTDAPPLPSDDDHAAEGLDPELLARVRAAQELAAADGVELRIVSGWRSAADQEVLVDQAVERYGSLEEAHRWVLPPEESAHVRGTAVDIGPTDGALWVDARQQELGLCRTYANEMWHFELTGAIGDPCPEQWPDASHGWG